MKYPALSLHFIVAAVALSPGNPPPQIPLSEAHCFQIDYLLRLPNLQAKYFIKDVAALGRSDAIPALKIANLSAEAAELRGDEERSYRAAAALLMQMGAPPALQIWAKESAGQLSQPVPMTKSEKAESQTDPEVAQISATMDEASALKSQTDLRMSDLGTWLALTHGAAGVWAANVGEVAANLQAALADGAPSRVSISALTNLQENAPAGVPRDILRALKRLQPPGGNLSELIPGPVTIPPDKAAASLASLLAGFHPPGLNRQQITAQPKKN